MLTEFQFKTIGRWNRLLLMVIGAFSLAAILGQKVWPAPLVVGIYGLVVLGALFANEFVLRTLRRLRDFSNDWDTSLSFILPTGFFLFSLLSFVLSQSIIVYACLAFVVTQAQLLGRTRFAQFSAFTFALGLVSLVQFHWFAPYTGSTLMLALGFLSILFCYYALNNLIGDVVSIHLSELDKLQSMAATDVLTGLTNRRQFNARLSQEISRARRHETPLTLVLFDLDNFKKINDVYGHPVGDRILKEISQLIQKNIRESDLSARYGGEEFALILPETREAEAYDLLERIRMIVAQTVFCLPENPLTITISIGLAQLELRKQTAFELVELADKALYEAKRLGKNQVVRGSNLLPTVLLTKQAV